MNPYTEKHVVNRYKNRHYVNKELSKEGLEAIVAYRKKIRLNDSVDYTPYHPRPEQRYMLVGNLSKEYFGEKVLDVGSRSNLLTRELGRECSLVDKHNDELPPFDWEKERIPYEDESYDTVVCLDTLEHIDDLHEGFYDLLRVSKKYVIISLPNNWKKEFNEMIKGHGRWASYGIPPEKPHDRHKWHFNTEDADNFIFYHSASDRGDYTVKEVVYHVPKTILRIKITHPILKAILPENRFKNYFVETIFYVLEKNS